MKVGDLVIVGKIEFEQEIFEKYIGKIGKIKYICTPETYADFEFKDNFDYYFEFAVNDEYFCPIAVLFNCFDSNGDNRATFLESELIVIKENQ